MDLNQPTTPTTPSTPSPVYAPASAAPGMFGTKIPSTVAFVIAVLLFLLPLSEIKCGGTTLLKKSGIDFTLSNDWKAAGGYGKELLGQMTSKTTGNKEGSSQIFAIAALALGVVGLILCLVDSKSGGYLGVTIGVLGAAALIGLMFEVKKWFDGLMAKEAADKAKQGADNLGLDKIGDTMSGGTLAFTPWFYISVIAFLAAAFFCYKRMSASKT